MDIHSILKTLDQTKNIITGKAAKELETVTKAIKTDIVPLYEAYRNVNKDYTKLLEKNTNLKKHITELEKELIELKKPKKPKKPPVLRVYRG